MWGERVGRGGKGRERGRRQPRAALETRRRRGDRLGRERTWPPGGRKGCETAVIWEALMAYPSHTHLSLQGPHSFLPLILRLSVSYSSTLCPPSPPPPPLPPPPTSLSLPCPFPAPPRPFPSTLPAHSRLMCAVHPTCGSTA